MRGSLLPIATLLCAVLSSPARAQEPSPLVLEATIPLGAVKGRIDHLAVDVTRQRLFVAELGNDTVGVVDLKERRLFKTLTGFSEPQGVGYVSSTNEIFVANGGDGTVHILGGEDFSLRAQIRLGEDADNVRVAIDPARVLVGYGNGALAVVDPATRALVADLKLTGHPEGFQIVPGTSRVLINVPDSREVTIVDLKSGKPVSSWPLQEVHGNYPLAMAETADDFWIVTRTPARLILMNGISGVSTESLESCGDADDVFTDFRRHRVYVSCGSGFIDVWESRAGRYVKIGHRATRSGARTALFVPELDRLYLAMHASAGAPAAIWIFRPAPKLAGARDSRHLPIALSSKDYTEPLIFSTRSTNGNSRHNYAPLPAWPVWTWRIRRRHHRLRDRFADAGGR